MMTDEQLIEELSFPVYRRVSTVIFAPGQSPNSSSVEMVTIDPRDLQPAQDRDNAMAPGCSPEAKQSARYGRSGHCHISPVKALTPPFVSSINHWIRPLRFVLRRALSCLDVAR